MPSPRALPTHPAMSPQPTSPPPSPVAVAPLVSPSPSPPSQSPSPVAIIPLTVKTPSLGGLALVALLITLAIPAGVLVYLTLRRRTPAMKRAIAFLCLCWLAIVAAAHTYGDLTTVNAGLYWNLPGHHWCGVEYRGHPGFFCDVT